MSRRVARVIAKQLPGKRDSGGRQRVAAFVEAYSQLFDEVVVYGFGDGRFELDNVTVRPFDRPTLRPFDVARHSVFAAKWRSSALADRFSSEVESSDFVHVDFPQMMVNCPSGVRPDVLDFHNIEAQLMASRTDHYPRLARIPLRMEVERLSRFETNHARDARLVTACSPMDVSKLRASGARAMLVPNGVAHMPSAWTAPPASSQVAFVGSMDYEPNREAASWLVADVWPIVRRINADARLLVAGRNAELVREITVGDATITILDSPPSIATVYEQSDICVVPLRSGAGTKIKVLEALAYGRPVVSTSVGMEGLAEVSDHVSVADDSQSFAEQISSLLRSPHLATTSQDLFRVASVEFGWPRRMEAFSALVAHERSLLS